LADTPTTIDQAHDALSRDPFNETLAMQLAWKLIAQGMRDEAKKIVQSSMDLHGNSSLHDLMSFICRKEGDLASAIHHARYATVQNTNNAFAWQQLGEALLAKEGPFAALDALAEAVRLKLGHSGFRTSLGRCYLGQSSYKEAEEQLRRAISLDDQNTEAHVVFANMYAGRGDYTSAIRQLLKATRIDPKNRSLLIKLSEAQEQDGMVLDAAITMEKAVALNPENPTAQTRLARLYQKAGKPADAERSLRAAIRLEPNAVRHHELSCIFETLGRLDEAIAAAKSASLAEPANNSYRMRVAALSEGERPKNVSPLAAGKAHPPPVDGRHSIMSRFVQIFRIMR
jgi:tetratricopeptide (TPR) repeat protein